jgi:hypothetical protein
VLMEGKERNTSSYFIPPKDLPSHMRTRKKKFLGILKSSWAQNTRVKLPSIGTSLTTLISTLRD